MMKTLTEKTLTELSAESSRLLNEITTPPIPNVADEATHARLDALYQEVMSLKANLIGAIQLELVRFERLTGITPTGINVEMADVSTFGTRRRHEVVDVEIDLGRL